MNTHNLTWALWRVVYNATSTLVQNVGIPFDSERVDGRNASKSAWVILCLMHNNKKQLVVASLL
jgi:hypothetical protein